ncbi:hypothetical protein Ancab_019597 [Ancistrocladus abbreviatus]
MAAKFLTKCFPLLCMAIALSLAPSSQGQTVVSTQVALHYQGGPMLVQPITNVYLVWYGNFAPEERSVIVDFFASFDPSHKESTIPDWWKTIKQYIDADNRPATTSFNLQQFDDKECSIGKHIKRLQIITYFKQKIESKALPVDTKGVYLMLTSKDVSVEDFCRNSCGFHDMFMLSQNEGSVAYGHVGDPSSQCPGLCSWPFAVPPFGYGPAAEALTAPNGVGPDGMVMNIVTVLAGAITNPFLTGFSQGNARVHLEAVSACAGTFGPEAYPGHPGNLMVDEKAHASYNVHGINGRKYLVPAIWSPLTLKCEVAAV